MNELIKVTTNENGQSIVSGRDLHEFLEVQTKYTDWFKRMVDYGFTENVDFAVFLKNENDETAFGGVRKIKDHALTLDMAKEISMIQRTEKGKQARQYFIEVEKAYKKESLQVLNQSTDDLKRANLLYKIANLTSDEELKEESLKSSYELVTGKSIHQKKTDYQKLYEAVTERYGDSVEDNLKGAIRFIRVWKG